MKLPDRNRSGRIVALTIGAAASELGMIAVTAKPTAQKLAVPTMRTARKRARSAPTGTWAVVRHVAEGDRDRRM